MISAKTTSILISFITCLGRVFPTRLRLGLWNENTISLCY